MLPSDSERSGRVRRRARACDPRTRTRSHLRHAEHAGVSYVARKRRAHSFVAVTDANGVPFNDSVVADRVGRAVARALVDRAHALAVRNGLDGLAFSETFARAAGLHVSHATRRVRALFSV